MSRRKSKQLRNNVQEPPAAPASLEPGQVLEAAAGTSWRPLVDGHLRDVRRERYRRLLLTVLLIFLLPVVCGLLVLPFFYRKVTASAPAPVQFSESGIYSLPAPPDFPAEGGSPLYEWLRLADPRQCLYPDSRAGFSRFLQFTPVYAADAFPRFKASESAAQPKYEELFSLIAPQHPRTVVNEELIRAWQQPVPPEWETTELSARPGVGRPVWHLADGTVVAAAEAPVLKEECLEHWRLAATREALSARLRRYGPRSITTGLEIQTFPALELPQVVDGRGLLPDRLAPMARVVLRQGCGDAALDQAAVEALRALVLQRAGDFPANSPVAYQLWVDWSCW